MAITIEPIGFVRSPFATPEGMPIQEVASTARGQIEIYRQYSAGLRDLDGFDYVIVLYSFHLTTREALVVTPFLDAEPHGVFATRAPTRPNRLGVSIVRLLKIEGSVLEVEQVDMADGTPVIDLKPFLPAFDNRPAMRIGWFAGRLEALDAARADGRMR